MNYYVFIKINNPPEFYAEIRDSDHVLVSIIKNVEDFNRLQDFAKGVELFKYYPDAKIIVTDKLPPAVVIDPPKASAISVDPVADKLG